MDPIMLAMLFWGPDDRPFLAMDRAVAAARTAGDSGFSFMTSSMPARS
jgi:hypothetical protein